MVIARGLKGGEEVVTDGHLRLTPGAQVIPGPAGETPAGAAGRRRCGRTGSGEAGSRAGGAAAKEGS